jgi:hypothetical protein
VHQCDTALLANRLRIEDREGACLTVSDETARFGARQADRVASNYSAPNTLSDLRPKSVILLPLKGRELPHILYMWVMISLEREGISMHYKRLE